MPANDTTNAHDRAYELSDIESLTDRAKRVLTVTAQQTGVTDTPDTDDVTIATTTSVRTELGLTNDEIAYELRKLEGGSESFKVNTPLIETIQQGVDDTGRQKAKRIELTTAGEAAVTDGVVTVETLHRGPEWLPQDADTEEQLLHIANRLHRIEQAQSELNALIGLAAITDIASDDTDFEALTRDELVADPETVTSLITSDDAVLERVEAIGKGQKALFKALKDATGVNAREYFE